MQTWKIIWKKRESKFIRLESMNFGINEAMKIAIQLTSASYLPVWTAIIASLNTLKEEDATGSYVTTLFIEEQEKVPQICKDTETASTDKQRTLASFWRQQEAKFNSLRWSKSRSMRWFNCSGKAILQGTIPPIRKGDKTNSLEPKINLM